ncbi:MAG: zinc-ribbon domain-containing protein [Acetobacter sp.]|nr:zinc-ribbon domain-containing protein [Acetobacter sp.]
MLISCPKCHSIYEIPDDLIPRTGQNFRCQACANVWHAMRQDAIGYEENENDEPYIEAIPVAEPPHRNYPANKTAFKVPADGKSGRKTRSSKEILAEEGTEEYTPAPKIKKKKEITLTSDMGTSFTISAPADEGEDSTPSYLSTTPQSLTVSKDDRLQPETSFKGYKKTYLLLTLLCIAAIAFFFRREITAFYPLAETYYNKISLSGQNNPQYLQFKNIYVSETIAADKPMMKIEAEIYNDSYYTTRIPEITVEGYEQTFTPARPMLKGYEKTTVEILLPLTETKSSTNLILSFKKP